jgi:hypothetical protein
VVVSVVARPPQFARSEGPWDDAQAVRAAIKRLSPEARARVLGWSCIYYQDDRQMFSPQISRRRQRIALDGVELARARTETLIKRPYLETPTQAIWARFPPCPPELSTKRRDLDVIVYNGPHRYSPDTFAGSAGPRARARRCSPSIGSARITEKSTPLQRGRRPRRGRRDRSPGLAISTAVCRTWKLRSKRKLHLLANACQRRARSTPAAHLGPLECHRP